MFLIKKKVTMMQKFLLALELWSLFGHPCKIFPHRQQQQTEKRVRVSINLFVTDKAMLHVPFLLRFRNASVS